MLNSKKLGAIFFDTRIKQFRALRGNTTFTGSDVNEFKSVFSFGTDYYNDAFSVSILKADGSLLTGALEILSDYEIEKYLIEIDIFNIALYADYDEGLKSWRAKNSK